MGKLKSMMEFFVEIEPDDADEVPEEAASDDPDVAAKAAAERAQQGSVGKKPDRPKRVREAASDPYAGALDEAALSEAVDTLDASSPGEVFNKIYRAAGLPPRGSGKFTIHKVEQLLKSEHLSGLSDKVKQRSILVTLESSNKSLDEVIQDAVARDKAIDQYDGMLRKDVKDLERQVQQENSEIEKEIEEYLKRKKKQMEQNKAKVEQARQMYEKWKSEKETEEQRLLRAVSVFVEDNPITEGMGDWEESAPEDMPDTDVFADGGGGGGAPSESESSGSNRSGSGASSSSEVGGGTTEVDDELADEIEKSAQGSGDVELSASDKELLEQLESESGDS